MPAPHPPGTPHQGRAPQLNGAIEALKMNSLTRLEAAVSVYGCFMHNHIVPFHNALLNSEISTSTFTHSLLGLSLTRCFFRIPAFQRVIIIARAHTSEIWLISWRQQTLGLFIVVLLRPQWANPDPQTPNSYGTRTSCVGETLNGGQSMGKNGT